MAAAREPASGPGAEQAWWFLTVVAALILFTAGFVLRLRCGPHCGESLAGRLLDMDALGGLPRLYTTSLFVGVAWVAWRAATWRSGRARLWWCGVTAVGVVLALGKLTSLHAVLKNGISPGFTLLAGSVATAVGLAALWTTGRRWDGAAVGPVVAVLALYAAAALGLDVVTGIAVVVQSHVGSLTAASATFVEELGEALSALLVLVVVRRQARRPVPAGRDGS